MKEVLSVEDKEYVEINTWEQALSELDRMCEYNRDYLNIKNVDTLCCEMTNNVEYWLLVESRCEDSGTSVIASKADDVFADMKKYWNNPALMKEDIYDYDKQTIDDLRHTLFREYLFGGGEQIVSTCNG